MEIEAKSLTEFAEAYCQKRYDKTLEKLITQLMHQERDVLRSVHFGFGHVYRVSTDSFISELLEKHFKLRALDKGKTFIIGDKIFGGFIFCDSKERCCFLSPDGTYVVPFTPQGKATWLHPYKIDYKYDAVEENEVVDENTPILVEKAPGVIYEYVEDSFFSFLKEENVEECSCIDYKAFLCERFGEDEYNKMVELIASWNRKIGSLARLPLSKLRKKNKDLFYGILYKNLFVDEYKLSLSDNERKIVTDYLKNCPHSNEISRMIYTFSYTLRGFEQDKEYCDYLDLTFVLVSVFKIVEVVFSNLLKEEFENKSIRDSKGNIIDFSDEKLTLGNMKQFFYSNDRDIQYLLGKNQNLNRNTLTILNRWIDDSRNGFLHKDIVEVSNVEQLNQSITDSLQLLCNLIILFKQP